MADPDTQRGYDRAACGVTRDELDAMGERSVRDKLNSGGFEYPGHKTHAFVSAWLANAEFVRSQDIEVKRSAREASTLRLARWANIIAIIAVIIAAIAARADIKWSISAVISWLL